MDSTVTPAAQPISELPEQQALSADRRAKRGHTKRAALISQRDLQRALRAMQNAGLSVKSLLVDPVTGKIVISTTTSEDQGDRSNTLLEDWMGSRNAR